MLKDTYCGDLRLPDVGRTVRLGGWVHRRRDHGGLIFIDLRDERGIVQVVFDPGLPEAHALAERARSEWVLSIEGTVRARSAATVNPNLPTGEVEVTPVTCTLLSEAKTPPFYINEPTEVDEYLRLRYRYLDLRRPEVASVIRLRHEVARFMREYLYERDFVEIETPTLIKSTPEGARDFLVPSRTQPGQFFALPQSPQIMKQLLMASGFERYFQFARCYRDEDARANRVAEHTQLDLEMSFVEEEDVMNLIEGLYTAVARKFWPGTIAATPFPRLTYADCMARYGIDRPDLRFGLELVDISDAVRGSDFQVFAAALADGGEARAIRVPGQAEMPRRQLDSLAEIAKTGGAKGLAHISFIPGEPRSPIVKFLTAEELEGIKRLTGAQDGDLVVIVTGPRSTVAASLCAVRGELANRLNLKDESALAFAWVTGFPLLAWRPDEQRWDAEHNPFSGFREEDRPYLESDPGKIMARQYDLVLNGVEIGGGSIRISSRQDQETIFRLMGHGHEEMQERFGVILDALEFGVPPEGGAGLGLDRFIMSLARTENMRDVIAFPKASSGADILMNAPSPVDEHQLRELGLQLIRQ